MNAEAKDIEFGNSSRSKMQAGAIASQAGCNGFRGGFQNVFLRDSSLRNIMCALDGICEGGNYDVSSGDSSAINP